MKLKNTRLATLICASFLGSAALSQAGILVSEDFTYADGGLNGQAGGTGFSAAWSSSTNVSGAVSVGNSASTRSLSTPFPSSGTLWVSFDWGNASKPTENGSYGGLTFYIGGSEKFLIGNTWPGTGHDVWQMNGSGQTSALNHPGMKTGVAKITLGAGATSAVDLWVGPAGSPVDVSGPVMATATNRELAGVNGIRINGQDFGGGSQSFDNLLIGETVADVDATDTPPTSISGTWTNPAGGQWGTSGNWLSNLVVTGSGSTADFNTLNMTADTTVNLDSARTIGNLVFGDTDTSTAAGWTLTNNAVAGNILILAGTTPTLTVNALGGTKTVAINAVIDGMAGLTKAGTGTLTLSAANTYTGTTSINNGTLQVIGQPYFNVGRTTTVASGAVFELNDSNNTFTSLMPVSTITGDGTFRLSGNSTINQSENGVNGTRLTFAMLTGGLIDLQGTSRLTNGGWQEMNWTSNLADMNIASGATFDIWDGQAVIIDALTGSGTVDKVHAGNSPSLLTVGIDNGSGTFSGTIMNKGGQIAFTKVGDGTQTLTGTNTYTGTTTVNGGTLSLGNGTSNTNLADSATVSLAFGTTVNLNFTGTDVVGKLIIDGQSMSGGTYSSSTPVYGSYFTGTGSLTILDQDGTWTSTVDGNWSDSANWLTNVIATGSDKTATFSAGTSGETITVTLETSRSIGNIAFSNANYTIAGGNTLTLDSTTVSSFSVAAANTATLNTPLAGTPGVEKTGDGTLALTGANTYTGGTTVKGGRLVFQNSTAGGHNYALNIGATLEFNVAEGNKQLNGGSITGDGIFVKSGPGQLWLGANGSPQTVAMTSGSLIDVQGGVMRNEYGNDGWGGNLADLNIASGAYLDLWDGNITVDALTGSGTVNKAWSGPHALTVGVDNGGGTFSGTISNLGDAGGGYSGVGGGTLHLVKQGTGIQALSGTISYSGNTSVNGGTLSISSAYLNDAATVSIASGAVLSLTHGLTDIVGALVINGTPLANGTYTASSSATTGYITGTGSIQVGATPADPFLAWIDATWPSLSDKAPTADPDNDGISNLVEYVLKEGNPAASSPGILPTVSTSGANFVFSYLRRTAATGTTQTFQYGSNLSGWTDVPVTDGGIVSITSPEAGIEQVLITVPKGDNTKLFGRLQVVK